MSNSSFPYISIVICVYNGMNKLNNGKEILFSCIDKISNQDYPSNKYEVLIIDDGSTHNTFSMSKDFINKEIKSKSLIKLISISHGGLSKARNFGIKNSKGDII